jgi:hypothetical protein
MADLDPSGASVTVGIATLRTPGLAGIADAATDTGESLASSGGATDAFLGSLGRLDIETQETITISDASIVDERVETARTSNGERAIELTVPGPAQGHHQMVIAVDESGTVTWHYSRDVDDGVDSVTGAPTRTYRIRRHLPSIRAVIPTRGLIGHLGKKVIRVLTFKIVGPVADYLASRWEERNRPYSLRGFDPCNYMDWAGPALSAEDWGRIAKRRALLFVHGTFSRAGGGFGHFDPQGFADLYEAYEGRVFAFDHFTISDDPESNVRWLLANVPAGIELNLDIVCHSRGGLVSRLLAEQGSSLGGSQVRVHRVALVAVPNQGTKLADTQHFNDLLDAFSTLLNLVPVPNPVDLLEAVLVVIREIVVAGQQGLAGIDCMVPGRPFLNNLNQGSTGGLRYFAVSSDFKPPAGAGAWNGFKDAVIDAIHQDKNDVMVTQTSAFGANGSPLFPISPADVLVYPVDGHIDHGSYFQQTETLASLLAWLTPVP